jgi:hypothetical protein
VFATASVPDVEGVVFDWLARVLLAGGEINGESIVCPATAPASACTTAAWRKI